MDIIKYFKGSEFLSFAIILTFIDQKLIEYVWRKRLKLQNTSLKILAEGW